MTYRDDDIIILNYCQVKKIRTVFNFFCLFSIKMQNRPVLAHQTALHRFSLAGCPERYKSDLRHLNYIISDASWQGAYFLYPFLGVAMSQQKGE